MSTQLTMTSKSKPYAVTFEQLMRDQLGRYQGDFAAVKENRWRDATDRPQEVERYTSREFKDKQIEFVNSLAAFYRTLFVTRKMVVAYNNAVNQQVSCPNWLNKNAFCLTSRDGLYHLPEWVMRKDLLKEIKTAMAETAKTMRAAKLAAEKEAKAAEKAAEKEGKASPKKDTKALAAPEKKASSKKKASKKAKKESAVEPTAAEPETLAPPSDDQETTHTEPVAEEVSGEVDTELAEETSGEVDDVTEPIE